MHLYLRNIGPLSEAALKLPRMLVLIGPQASGKSTLAKAIFLFERLIVNYFRDDIFERIQNYQLYQPFPDKFYAQKIRTTFEDLFGYRETYLPDLQAVCTYPSGVKAIFELDAEGYLTFRLEGLPDTDWLQDTMYRNRSKEQVFKLDTMEQINELNKKCYSLFGVAIDPFYLPTSREMYHRNVFNERMTKRYQEPDDNQEPYKTTNIIPRRFFYFLENDLIGLLRNRRLTDALTDKPRSEAPACHDLADLSRQVLRAELSNTGGILGFEVKEHKVSADRGSSGQQEAFSVLLAVAFTLLKQGNWSLTVEEPESGLFPEGQEKLVRALALAFNANPDNRVTLTTHSPYIITSLNNLLTAHDIVTEYPELKEQVAAIVPETMWIDPAQVGAYHVEHGTISSILSKNNLVVADKIDTASDDIGDVFDALIRLQLDHKRKQHA